MYCRAIQSADESLWRKLWLAYLDSAQVELNEAHHRALWQSFFVTEPSYHAFLCFDDNGQVLGFSHVLLHPSTWDRRLSAYLEDLFVRPQARRQGVAKLLIQFAQTFAQESACARLYWHTKIDNDAARKLYEQLALEVPLVQYRIDW